MAASKIIRQLLLERGMSVKGLAEKLDILPQSMSNKLNRDLIANISHNFVVPIQLFLSQ